MVGLLLMNLALYSLEAGGIGCCLKGLFGRWGWLR